MNLKLDDLVEDIVRCVVEVEDEIVIELRFIARCYCSRLFTFGIYDNANVRVDRSTNQMSCLHDDDTDL